MTGGADGTNKNPNLWMCVKRTKTVYERRSEWSIRKTNIKLKRSFQQTIQHWKRNPKKTEWIAIHAFKLLNQKAWEDDGSQKSTEHRNLQSKGETQTLRVVPVIFRAQFDFIHLIPFFQKQNVFFYTTRLFAEKRNNLSYRVIIEWMHISGIY